jgi:hypothetical protein
LKQPNSGYLGSEASISEHCVKSSFIKKRKWFESKRNKKQEELSILFRSSEGLGVKEAIATMHKYLPPDSESFIKRNTHAKDKEIQFPVPGICCCNGMQY